MVDLCQVFNRQERQYVDKWRRQLTALANEGKVALWGAGAKGVTLANLIDPQRELIACVVDLNPDKQGGYLPGTGHPIIAYQDLPQFQVKTCLVMNPNYLEENQALLRSAQLDIVLLDPSLW